MTITQKRLLLRKKKLNESLKIQTDDKDLQTYLFWLGTSDAKKRVWREAWLSYYQNCRETPAFELYKQMCEAFEIRDVRTTRELLEANRAIQEANMWIPELQSIDPFELENSDRFRGKYDRYEKTKKDIRAIEEELELYDTDDYDSFI